PEVLAAWPPAYQAKWRIREFSAWPLMGRGVWWARQHVNECEFLESDGRVIEQAVHSTTEVGHAWHATNSRSARPLISRLPGWGRQRPVDHMKSFGCCRPKLVSCSTALKANLKVSSVLPRKASFPAAHRHER